MTTFTSTPKQRADEQWETVKKLNALSGAHWTVDAGGLDVDETQGCDNDTAHGLGTCHNEDMPGLCPECAVQFVAQGLVQDAHIAIDVTR